MNIFEQISGHAAKTGLKFLLIGGQAVIEDG
jgi:hypothetical protein